MVTVADDVVAPTALVAGAGAHFVHVAAKMSVGVALQVFAKRWAAVVALLTVPAFGADAEIAVLVVAVRVLDVAVTLPAAAVSEIDVTPAVALAVASGVAMAVEAEIAVRVTASEKE